MAIAIGIDVWKHSDGREEVKVSLWVDQGAGKSATHIFNGKSFQELLDFLDIKEPPDERPREDLSEDVPSFRRPHPFLKGDY